MASIPKYVLLRSFLFLIGPCIPVVLNWGTSSISVSLLLAGIAILLHFYYRHVYVPLPTFFIRLAAFIGIQLILAAFLRGQGWVAPVGFIPQLDESPAVPMEGKISSDFLSSHPIVTMSIVLPCANEGRFAWLTAQSIAELTPPEVLHEIIVVDDGSTPPLSTQFPPEIVEKSKVRFVRHETHTGLINAKAAGGNIATGDLVVFLDCHVKPAPGWEKPIIEMIRSNYRRIVVPSITGLNPDTWEEVRGNGGTAKCYLTWDSDFKWFDSDDDNVAVMSGGLLAMSRQWWIETGGYDVSFKGWGGENIDQSLRGWLCGGEIMNAATSYIGHMWRTNDKPETRARYTVPAGSVTSNRYRGAAVWMADWKEKLETFPEFGSFKSKQPDMSSIQSVKDRLQCKDFSYFIDKFYKVYHWGGLLPQSVFHLRDSNSGLCLQRTYSSKVILTQCSDTDAGQLWHRANRDGNQCCSGYRNWNTDQCIVGGWIGGKASTGVCNIGGKSHDQYVTLNPETHQLELTKRRGACLGGELTPRPKAQFVSCSKDSTAKKLFKKISISSQEIGLAAPEETVEYVRFEDASRPGLCLAALGGATSNQGRIEVHDCDPQSVLQKFAISKADDGNSRIEAMGLTGGEDDKNLCLDAGLSSTEIGLYPCYSDNNTNQDANIVAAGSDAFRIEFANDQCVAIPNSAGDKVELTKPLELHGCVSDGSVIKRGQAFEKLIPNRQEPTVFALKNKDGNCLTVDETNHFVLSKDACSQSLFTQDPADGHKRLKHIATALCFDGNNGITPTLYSCYEGENTNQQIDLSVGYIKLERTQTCVDFEPVKPSPVTAIQCSAAQGAFKWEEYKPFVPIETEIYNRKKKQ
jgi:glycosyltransferase involved in cell wall biosynthesis